MARKPKRPKAPKRSATIQTWQGYESRRNAWSAKCKQIDADKKKKADLIERLSKKRF
ncbi:hypothetical protein ES705_06383 [subsurface metagenome]